MDESKAKLVKATCIELLGAGELTNKVRRSASLTGRITLDVLQHLTLQEGTLIAPKHLGLAFILNTIYNTGMSALALCEAICGVWSNIPNDERLKFAYATYGGLNIEVYEIHCWVDACSKEYFTK